MAVKLEEHLAGAAKRFQKNGSRVPIRRNGKIVAAVVSAEDFKTLEAMDRLDAKIARQALANARAKGEKPIPWSEARKLLNLD
jgi:hypothetical protein